MSPAMTPDEAIAHLVANDPRFQVEMTEIRGDSLRVFRNAPASVGELLTIGLQVRGNKDAPYLYFEGERWTYGEFCEEVYALANLLQNDFGVTSGSRVCLCSRNTPEMLFGIMAISLLGGTTVFLNSWWTTSELEYAIENCEALLILGDARRCENLLPLKDQYGLTLMCYRDPAPAGTEDYNALIQNASRKAPEQMPIDTDSDFGIMFTSGSSGKPKGVLQTQRGVVNSVYSGLMLDSIAGLMAPTATAPEHNLMIVTPLFHVTACHACFLWSLISSAKLTVVPKWEAEVAVATIRDEGITRLVGVPTQSVDLLEACRKMGETLPTLGSITSGGAKRPESQVAELANAFPHARIASGYGLTETNVLGLFGGGPDYVSHPSSSGRLVPPLQDARFVDDNGNDVAPGDVGELVLRGCNIMRGYLNDPYATADAIRDGWFHTGDLAKIDDEGFVYIVGRKKEVIIRGGENIACLELDSALYAHPDVIEANVFSIPDDRLGEVVGAAVQIKPDTAVDAEQLSSFSKDQLAAYKIPVRYWFIDGPLARTTTDKIDRRVLRAQCLENL
jgi:long-chain acyl-CoA synthetase